jgi:hypothetical protein
MYMFFTLICFTGDEGLKPIQNVSKTKKEESISLASLLKSRKNILNKKVWNKESTASSFKPGFAENRLKAEATNVKGPRIKHVCRSASVVLKLPVATIVDHQDQLSSTSQSEFKYIQVALLFSTEE